MDYQNSFQIKGEVVPYYHFHYEKEFKEVIRIKNIQEKNRSNRYYFKDGTYLPKFIRQETIKQYDFSSGYVSFGKVMIIIIHSFSDDIPKDLDNYHYKPFIDVIRKLKIVEDDSWQQVGITTLGQHSEIESIDLYVVPYHFYVEFLCQKLSNLFKESYRVSTIRDPNIKSKLENSLMNDDGFFM